MTDGTAGGPAVEDRPVDRTDRSTGGRASEWATVYLKGMAMGAADTVPGVSGGTIALITGIYERLIAALAALDPRLLGEFRGVHRRAGRRRLLRTIVDVDLPFLVVLGLGVVTSVVALSRVVHGAILAYRAVTYAFFFGLIAASAVVLYRELTVEGPADLASGAVGFALAFVVSGASSAGLLPESLPVVFLTGAVTITAMVLPGVSGAFILILLGQYTYLTDTLEQFVDGLAVTVTGGRAAGLADGAAVVGTFVVGAVVGLLTVARLIAWALAHYRAATLAFLVSLMVGSLRLPVLEIRDAVGTWTPSVAAGVAAAAAVGGLAVLALDRYTDDLELDATG